jgi:flagellar basal body-associated protein FliL
LIKLISGEKMAEEMEKSRFKITRKLIIIAGGVFLLLVAVLFAVFILFFTGNEENEQKNENGPEASGSTVVYTPGPEDFYSGLLKFGEITVKLKPEFEEELPRNLRVTVYAEVINDSDKFLLLEKKNLIENYLISYFREKKPSDIDEITEKIIIKQEIFRRINEVSGREIMKNIYFTEFLILDW